MTSLTETILKSKDSKGCWRVSSRLQNKETIILQHGVKSCRLELAKATDQEGHLSIEPEIAQALCLPTFKNKYRVKFTDTGQWIFGPLVGIFINERWLQELLSQKSMPICSLYTEVLDRNQGLAVFFSLDRILWNKGEVLGVIRDSSQSAKLWKEQLLPIPTVIYDRCFGSEGRVGGMTLRSTCASYDRDIKVINTLPKLGKIETYTICSQYDSLRKHFPQWDIFNKETGASLLEKYPVAYIKPDRLSRGKGVTKVTHTSKGYLLEQRRRKLNYQHLCATTGEVLNKISHYLKYNPMVIQEIIPLQRYKDRPFDFRLLLQKDCTGQWKQTGIAARICGEGSIISGPRSGGEVSSYKEVMKNLPEDLRDKIALSLLKLAKDIAQALEEQMGLYAELGFDLGVDKNGYIWVIEVNGKPLKVSIERLQNKTITLLAYKRPIEYAIYLAGFRCSYGGVIC